MKAYVINLDRNPERLNTFKLRFDTLGLAFEKHTGVDGKKISEKDFVEFKKTRPRGGRTWIRGKMGCFLSHYTLWRKIAESCERYSAIFEDDIYVSDTLKEFLKTDSWIPEGADIIRLETSTNRVLLSKQAIISLHGRKLFKVQSTSWCAAGYILSRQAATHLADLPDEHHMGADRTLFCYEDSVIAEKMNTFQVFPALCIQDKFIHTNANRVIFKSEIVDNDDEHNFKARLKYALKKSPFDYLHRSLQGYKRIHFVY